MKYHIALSYASSDAWIAKDLYEILISYNYSVYCYDKMPDETQGILRDKLREIYQGACLNILLWSSSYDNNSEDSFASMERRFIVDRHLYRGDDDALMVVCVDESPLPKDFDMILAHNIKKTGLLGLENIITERLQRLSFKCDDSKAVCHPMATTPYRSQLEPCTFRIHRNWKRDPYKRWKQLADILTVFPNSQGTKCVYLIPSGGCMVHLRHTGRLKTNELYLEAKRIASEEFIGFNLEKELCGFWFIEKKPRKPEYEVVTLYCSEYDQYLNENVGRVISEIKKAGDKW